MRYQVLYIQYNVINAAKTATKLARIYMFVSCKSFIFRNFFNFPLTLGTKNVYMTGFNAAFMGNKHTADHACSVFTRDVQPRRERNVKRITGIQQHKFVITMPSIRFARYESSRFLTVLFLMALCFNETYILT